VLPMLASEADQEAPTVADIMRAAMRNALEDGDEADADVAAVGAGEGHPLRVKVEMRGRAAELEQAQGGAAAQAQAFVRNLLQAPEPSPAF